MKETKLLKELIVKNNYKYGIELGVRQGITCFDLCHDLKDLNMVEIDLWPTNENIYGIISLEGETFELNENNYNVAKERFSKFGDRIKIIRKYTLDAANDLADSSYDFIFIDSTHTYDSLRKDILAYLPKIKESGMVCGHDYVSAFNGIIKCVEELSDIKNDINNGIFVDQYTLWYIYKKNVKKSFYENTIIR